jgi:cysteine synthase
MSEGNSVERQRMLRALGAEVVLAPQADGYHPGRVTGADLEKVRQRAEELTAELGAFQPRQFDNPGNAAVHEECTGAEIWEQTGGRVDAWTAMVGTGGTYVGVACALKRHNPAIRCIALEPAGARPLAGVPTVSEEHKIQGAGYNLIPPCWDPALADGFLGVTDDDAIATARELARREGVFAGFSSGANVWAALELARECEPGSVIVTVCPDTGLKYLSTDLFP